MIVLLYLTLLITSVLSLFLSSTPITLGLNILVMALLLACAYASIMSSWYAFLIFLIYVGGMLVMFAYFLAITPNEQIPSKNITIATFLTIVILYPLLLITGTQGPLISEFMQESAYLYLGVNSPMLVALALLLLFVMVIVVKLTYRSKGPLRPFKYV